LPGLGSSETGVPTLPAVEAPAVQPDSSTETSGDIIRVSTDVFEVEINTAGGRLQRISLKNYPVAKDRPNDLVELLSTDDYRFGALQSGLIADAGEGEQYFSAAMTATTKSYAMNGDEKLVVPLLWYDGNGVKVEKRFRFTRGSYRIDVEHHVSNRSDASWRAAPYTTLQRLSIPLERSMFNVDTYSFDGPIVYDGAKSEKLKRDDLLEGPFKIDATAGWAAVIQHHFLSAIIPDDSAAYHYDVKVRNSMSTTSVFGPTTTVAPGAEHTFNTTLFVGPKEQRQLEQIDPSLKLTVDYGILTLLSNPLFWLLSKIFSVFGNWGVAIILTTVLIKAAFYKLTEKSGRSMAKMREIQPRMKALQDRYKDDRQALSQAMMDLYKREKVNPAAGCLPILIQMPFFLAFYWVLLESVEMRQAPFALWITDLSSRDPFFILPIIMGAAMLMQQRLNPAPADPVQAKVMQIMPIVFTGFFAFFPSGLVLYWVTNTLLSIAQQWYVNKVVSEEQKSRKNKSSKPPKKKSKKKGD
ncbi:MAG: membrane protein insertase YidC, partial [Proteobacteria bacterium]|nr:membrane protein insertase YidC [Pseudomonadota bacterium]